MMLAERSELPAGEQKYQIRQFQLADFIYSDFINNIDIKNHRVILHCAESGNLGDIGHLMNCAHAIKTFRPDYEVELLIELKTANAATIYKIFPLAQYKVTFVSVYKYEEREATIKQAMESGCVIGISASLASAHIYKTHHRHILEYGYEWTIRANEINEWLSMGLSKTEEGILIPTVIPRTLDDVQTPWIKAGLQRGKKLYHFHQRSWDMQMTSLYTLALLEEKNQDPITIVMPGLANTLHDLVSWGMLNTQFLNKQGIADITRVTSEGEETISTTNANGKKIILICGDIPKLEMEALQIAANDFFGCAGDVSFSECIALAKLPFYDIYSHKETFFKSVHEFAVQHNLKLLAEYFALFLKHFDHVNQTYRDFPRPKNFYAPQPSYDLNDPASIPRKSVPVLKDFNEQTAKQIANLAANHPDLLWEAKRFSELVKKYRDFIPRLLSIVDRGVVLANHPQFVHLEASLLERFSKNEINLQQVFTAIHAELHSLSQQYLIDIPGKRRNL